PPNTFVPSLAVSPDGGTLVMGEAGPYGRLWLKRRDQLDAEPITGAEVVSYPNFSPDGQWISFVDNNTIKKVRPGQGGITTIIDSVDGPFGGHTWLDDGSVVYAGPQLHELSRVSGSGGPRTTVLLDSTLAGRGVANLSALPRSRGVLFTECT